jgi:2',3'-cyclic-nucleotide 2'-phosphodiesterase (5'-nucleotidase family)
MEDFFVLELLHVADQEAGAAAIQDAPRLSAVLNALKAQDLGDDGLADNTLVLSSGDAFIPGLFFEASEPVFGTEGIADIQIQNELGFQAIAFGNHEFDFGTRLLAELISGQDVTDDSDAEDGFVDTVPQSIGTILGSEFTGANFPYLSTNLNFATDINLAPLAVKGGQAPQPNTVTSSVIIDVNGEPVGVVGATTPTLASISSPGDVGIAPSPFDSNPTPAQLDALAAAIQTEVDALLEANSGLNKIVLLAHMQQIAIELALAERLENVDIIVAGGSNTRLLDATDRLRAGDSNQGEYPQFVTNAGGTQTAIVNTDGSYKYVGRLVLEFDADGNIVPESYDAEVSGAYATDAQGVADLGAESLVDPEIQAIVNAIEAQIISTESNVFGAADVFLNGNRSGADTAVDPDGVRTQETNLGNLTADANLAAAQEIDPTVVVSLKNGGGIRASIGQTFVPPGSTESTRTPNEAVIDRDGNVVKPAGGISQNDIQTTLAFNNGLTLLTLTKTELVALLEHGVSALPNVAGAFPQIAGVKFSYDPDLAPGDRLQSAAIVDQNDTLVAELVRDGELVGDPSETFRIVTLNFLAAPRFDEATGEFIGGGDGYPFPNTNTDPAVGEVGDPDVVTRVNIVQLAQADVFTGDATFAEDGSEQDALAEYLFDNFVDTPFDQVDTGRDLDERIQNLNFRTDTVLGEGSEEPTPPEEPTLPPVSFPEFDGGFEGPFAKIGGVELPDGAEINAFDAASAKLFVVSGEPILQVVDLSDPTTPTLLSEIDLSDFGAGINSVAVFDGLVAVAVEADLASDDGTIVFFDAESESVINSVTVGALPDMVTFTPDGTRVLVANEGEPNEDYTVDPEGSISIIDVSNGAENATVLTADFLAFNDRKADLQADGVKLFGPDGTTVAQDLEPEYIAVAPDGLTAWVTLQENNAVAVVDIASATVEGILPLGFKDFSRGQPNLTNYEIRDRGPITNGGAALVTATGDTIELGGFSGLYYDGVADNGNLKFLAVPDRGPNGDVTDGNRPFLLPDYQARIVSLEVNESMGDVLITKELFLTREDGTPITGLPNIPGIDERAVDAAGEFVDLDFLEGFDAFGTDYDPLGADLEGIVRAPDDTYWMVDEYRPAIYHFDTDGVLIDRFVPAGTVDQANAANPGANFAPGTFGTETLPAEYFNRRANRGFEGMALDTDAGILYAFIQTPLNNPDRETGDNSSVIRMLGIDPATGEPVAEYVYLLQKPDIGGNVDKIGDAVYAGDGQFFVMERDSSLEPTAQKFVFEVDLKGATNVLGMDFGGETLEQQTADDLATMGITPVNKVKVTNLPSIGYLPSDKPEGLALLPDGRLAVLNDNDFGLVAGAEAVELGLIDFGEGNRLDASNEDGGINLQNWPVFGTFQPDSIASFEFEGKTYYATANEGDARIRPDGDIEDDAGNVITPEGTFFNEEARLADVTLDPDVFPDAATLQMESNLGRLNITTALGDLDGDGDLDQIVSYGARSFSIWDENGNLVYDSGDDIAKITAQLTPDFFNANDGDPEEFDQRSDDKGAEPEALTIGQMGDATYAFVGLERAGGGVLVYDITNPLETKFVQYIRDDADIAPEGLSFISSEDSPNGDTLLLVTNEESNTLAVYAAEASEPMPDPGSGAEPVGELLDLTGLDGNVTANVTLSREAAFDNILQFYATDAQGTVNGLLPGEAGYEDAVRQQLLGAELFVENLETTNTNLLIGGGTYYAPALLIDGDVANLVTIDDGVTGMSRIQRDGNVWRFEDLTDFDFNDFVLTVNSAEVTSAAA